MMSAEITQTVTSQATTRPFGLSSMLALGVEWLGFTPTTAPNMNGEYKLSKTPGAPTDKSFPTNFKDYPGGVEV